MVEARHVTVKDGDVLVLVGTMKGAFLLRSNGTRARWEIAGPYFPGHSVYAMAYDGRNGRRRLWAGTSSMHWGAVLRSSDDFGRTWTNPESANVRFPVDTSASLKQIWQIRPAGPAKPDTLYCGVEPAALFESHDAGETWTLNRGLYDHPHRSQWQPGGGGLCLHTILPDPRDNGRITIAISTGGVYRTDDGGRTWQVKNRGVRAQFLPDPHPEFGQCVHKVVQNPQRPERLFLQNHWGLYRSEDGGDSWQDIANGVPSDFGFAMVAHPHDAETVYIAPLESDEFRCMPEGKLRVYRTRDSGASWEALTRGLPQQDALETVLRDAMSADPLNPAGIYFGTRNGQLYASADGGASWSLLHGHLPPIVCVRAIVVGDPSRARVPKRASARATRARPRVKRTAARAKAKHAVGRTKRKVARAKPRRSSRGR
jgi:photosystem II stability/assembly factor-like uncharacterized protein